jgi:hypothetical protein
MLRARQPAPLIQINPRSGAALQLRPGLPVCVAPAFQAGSAGKEVIEEEWNETGPKVRVGSGHNFACNPGLARQAGAIDLNARKDDALTVNILASCAKLSNVQFELNVLNLDKIRRLFPGMEEMEIFYDRCQI